MTAAVHGPLGSWPLECWIFDCAFPRVGDGRFCLRHGGKPSTPQVSKVPAEELPSLRPYACAQSELLAILRDVGAPLRLTDIARRRGGADMSATAKTLRSLEAKGLAERLGLGLYAAVQS